ncbi:lipid II flippase MurJ [Melioribacteraceae bacterium 4301-Me]|uniref:lipid II flippase MurJ n=1 Tax=Pyranulibacter aquaticus TaxID=3163344 RepID=UPI003599CEAE
MLKKWLHGLIGLSAFALLGRLLGFLREILMASKFGATEITDAYLTTLLLFDIAIAANSSILSGTLSYYTQIKNSNVFYKSLFNIGVKIFIFSFIVSLILYPISGFILPLIFTKSTIAAQTAINTSRLLFILTSFLVPSGIFAAVLQLKGKITNPGQMIVFLNVSSIISLIFLTKYFGIISLPIGLLIGGVLFFIYQIFLTHRIDLTQKTKENFYENSLDNKFNIFGWSTVILLIFGNSLIPSLSGLIERYFAYSFVEGTFSHYQYALKVILLPLTIFSFAISTSLLPIQTKLINEGEIKEFYNATNKGILVSVLTSIFFVLLFSVLSQPIIQVIYQRGHFTLHDSVETSHALQIMAIALIPFLLSPVLANIFYSLKSAKNLIAINLLFVFIQAIVLFFLSKVLSGIEALAITWVTVGWLNSGFLIYYLIRFKRVVFDRVITLKLLLIALITTIIIILCKNLSQYLFALDNINEQTAMKILLVGLTLLLIYCTVVFLILRDMIIKISAYFLTYKDKK